MSVWAVIIALLSFLLVLSSIVSWDSSVQSMISYMILLVALAILHRIWSKTKAGRFELLIDQLDELRKENEELRKELKKEA
ncbi:MAG: hypothetical protein ACP5G4_05745 [bacterium]